MCFRATFLWLCISLSFVDINYSFWQCDLDDKAQSADQVFVIGSIVWSEMMRNIQIVSLIELESEISCFQITDVETASAFQRK